MKRILKLAFVFVMLLTLCACGEKTDKTFLSNLAKGLEARWKISDSGETFATNSEYKDNLRDCVNAELNAIGDISNYTFSNTTLAAYATEYMDALNSQLDGIKYYGSDDAKYDEQFNVNGYNARAILICKLVDEYGFSVSTKFANVLDDMVNTGYALLEEADFVAQMQAVITDDTTLECLGGTDYEIVLENTTEYDLSNATLYFNFYDEDGVLVDSSTSFIDSWKSGSKNKIQVWEFEEFSAVEMMISIYSQTTYEELTTDYVAINYVNDMVVTIELTSSIPGEFSYSSSSGNTYTVCTVTDFSYQVDSWYDGKASATIQISGVKTYDDEGRAYSRSCLVGWKLYDEMGTVIDSGNFYSSDIAVGESFSDCTSYLDGLSAGNYTLELLNVE